MKIDDLPKSWEELSRDKELHEAICYSCRSDLRIFTKIIFKYFYRKKFIWHEDLHGVIFKALMRVWAGKEKNIILNMPPRYGKTEMLCMFMAWAYGHNPMSETIHLSYSDNLVFKNSKKIMQIIDSAMYRDIFRKEILTSSNQSGYEWSTKDNGLFVARSTSGQVTGYGAGNPSEYDNGEFLFSGCIWIDDPIKPKDALTAERAKINETWGDTIKSRRNSSYTPTIVTMQRVHEDDFTTTLMNDNGEDFKRYKLKALRDDNSALWPQKHDAQALNEMLEFDSYTFYSQYQQEPTVKGGNIFKIINFPRYKSIPENFVKLIITCDTAMKTGQHNDFSCGELWGLYENNIYLIDMIHGKWESDELLRVFKDFILKSKKRFKKLRGVYIEDKASGSGLIQQLKRRIPVPVFPVQRNKDKVERAKDVVPYQSAGMVKIPLGYTWADNFITECESFNEFMTHKHDDMVDPMIDAINVLIGDQKKVTLFDCYK